MSLKEKVIVTLIVTIWLFIFISLPIRWINESETYNRLTGANTTWWDAIWVELRVQDQPIRRDSNGN